MECLCPSVHPLVSPRRKVWITYIQAYMPHESSEDSSNQPDGPMGSPRCPLDPLGPPGPPQSTRNRPPGTFYQCPPHLADLSSTSLVLFVTLDATQFLIAN